MFYVTYWFFVAVSEWIHHIFSVKILGFETKLLSSMCQRDRVDPQMDQSADYKRNKHQHRPGLNHNLSAKWDKQLWLMASAMTARDINKWHLHIIKSQCEYTCIDFASYVSHVAHNISNIMPFSLSLSSMLSLWLTTYKGKSNLMIFFLVQCVGRVNVLN